MEMTIGLFVSVALLGTLCHYVDASLGMGYGMTLTPIMLLIGFAPVEVVPVVLVGQLAGGVIGGYFHHRLGNVKLDFRPELRQSGRKAWSQIYRPRSLDAKVVLILVGGGLVGSVLGVAVAINIPPAILMAYVGTMVMVMGLIMLWKRNHNGALCFKRLMGFAVVAAFNKGMWGGGYGPLATGGQILSGREVRNSVGTVTIAEAVVVVVAIAAYMTLQGLMPLNLVAAVSVGALIAGPLAALTVKNLRPTRLKVAAAVALTLLGSWLLIQTFVLGGLSC